MSDWKSRLKKASFKGIPFQVDTAIINIEFNSDAKSSQSSGIAKAIAEALAASDADKTGPEKFKDDANKQSTQTGAIPLQQAPFIRINSVDPIRFPVRAHFAGSDYLTRRDKFLQAIRSNEPGELILPTYDPVRVVALNVSTIFSNEGGGWEDVEVLFVEQGEEPKPRLGTATSLATAATEANTAAQEDFDDGWETYGASSVADAAETQLLKFTQAIRNGFDRGRKGAAEYEQCVAAIEDLEDDIISIIATPSLMSASVQGVLATYRNSFTRAADAYTAQLQAFDEFQDSSVPVTGTLRNDVQRAANQTSQLIIVQIGLLANAVDLLAELTFASVNDTETVRTQLTVAIDTLQSTIGDITTGGYQETYTRLIAMRAAVWRDLADRTAALPSLEQRDIRAPLPAYALAMSKYGNANRYAEIIVRNDTPQSLFVSGETELLST